MEERNREGESNKNLPLYCEGFVPDCCGSFFAGGCIQRGCGRPEALEHRDAGPFDRVAAFDVGAGSDHGEADCVD